MKREKPIRVVMAKAGLDAHERGLITVCMGLRDEGMEIIYTGLRQTPEMVLQAAIQEGADVLGISSLAGGHNAFVSKLRRVAQEKGFDLDGLLILVGGIIPREDIATLKDMGVSATFGPGTSIQEISDYIKENIRPR